jgi:hypothetical protein
MRVLVLGAQPFRNELLNVKDLESPLLIPDSGKPIFHQMSFKQSGGKTSFVIDEEAHLIDLLLQTHLKTNSDAEILKIPRQKLANRGLVSTIRSALEISPCGKDPLLIAFADNLFDFTEVLYSIKKHSDEDWEAIAFSTYFLEAQRYTYFKVDKELQITDYLPKGFYGHTSLHLRTDVGVYYFKDSSKLFNILKESNFENMKDVLLRYDVVHSLPLESWRDLGHWDLLTNANQVGQVRSFNSLDFDKKTGCLIKKSNNLEKIRSEILFYQTLPKDFQLHFPRLHHVNSESGQYSMEYWPLKSLSEYIVYWGLSTSKLIEASTKIGWRLEEYSNYRQPAFDLKPEELYEFYSTKFTNSFTLSSSLYTYTWLLGQSSITLNGRVLNGFPVIIPSLLTRLKKLCSSPIPGFLHGDLCFSNVLFSPEEGIIKFIDPRGSFINFVNYGDLRYDLAKLFQGLGGFYDYIKAGFYSLSRAEDQGWNLKLFVEPTFIAIIPTLEQIFLAHFPDIQESDIYFLVALNFISLLPLHIDNHGDQLVFILVSLLILNSGNAYSLIEGSE